MVSNTGPVHTQGQSVSAECPTWSLEDARTPHVATRSHATRLQTAKRGCAPTGPRGSEGCR